MVHVGPQNLIVLVAVYLATREIEHNHVRHPRKNAHLLNLVTYILVLRIMLSQILIKKGIRSSVRIDRAKSLTRLQQTKMFSIQVLCISKPTIMRQELWPGFANIFFCFIFPSSQNSVSDKAALSSLGYSHTMSKPPLLIYFSNLYAGG